MTLLVDAAPLVALADCRDPARDTVRAILHAEAGALVVPAQVTAEADYLLGKRIGRAARLAFLDDLAAAGSASDVSTPQTLPRPRSSTGSTQISTYALPTARRSYWPPG